jgi:hypothetical protein
MKPHYYVFRPGYGAPKQKHETFRDAVKESVRLANENPGAAFEVLKCEAITQVPKSAALTFYLDGVDMPSGA